MQRILIQLDTDPLPSAFDRVVAVDAGAEHLFSYGGVTVDNLETLVHGAIFTRGPADLKHTAIFVGGSRVDEAERLFGRVKKTFFGPMRVSAMMDANGSNTTAAAALVAARKHVDLKGATAVVLGGTGPVGHRAAELLARAGAKVRLASRSIERARAVVDAIRTGSGLTVEPRSTGNESETVAACEGASVLIAAGAAGVALLSAAGRAQVSTLKVAIDLNAVPPLGLEGIEVGDKAVERDGAACYGAIGVGGTKMKIHKACIERLFQSNDQWLDTPAIDNIAQEMFRSVNRDDNALMQAVQAGDFRVFDQLVARYRGPLQRVAAGMLDDAELAEDVVQETFLAVFAARHTYDPAFQFRTWLWTILLNRCKRLRARRQRKPQMLAQSSFAAAERAAIAEPASPDTTLAAALRLEQQVEIEEWLQDLSDPQADAIRLRFFAGLTYEQMAQSMGVSLGGARLRVRSGLATLAEIIRARRGDDA